MQSKATWSCYAAFFSLGAFVSLWAIELPRLKAILNLSVMEVAGAGFALGGAAVAAMSLLPPWLHRYGSGVMQRWTWLGMVLAMPWPFMAESVWGLYIFCACVGAFSGSLDVAMNAQSLQVEQQQGARILSKLHGAFSLAGLLGALLGYQLLRWEVSPLQHALLFMAICAALWWSAKAYLVDRVVDTATDDDSHSRSDDKGQSLAKYLVFILSLTMGLSLTVEGSVEMWAGIYLNTIKGWPFAESTLGYAAFACAMVSGRWTGDYLRRRIDTYALLLLSCVLAGAGYMLVLSGYLMLLGYFILGWGLALQVPLFFVIADQSPHVDTATAVARISAVGYSGLLLGPVLVGAAATQWGLWWALFIVAVLPLLQLLLVRRLSL